MVSSGFSSLSYKHSQPKIIQYTVLSLLSTFQTYWGKINIKKIKGSNFKRKIWNRINIYLNIQGQAIYPQYNHISYYFKQKYWCLLHYFLKFFFSKLMNETLISTRPFLVCIKYANRIRIADSVEDDPNPDPTLEKNRIRS